MSPLVRPKCHLDGGGRLGGAAQILAADYYLYGQAGKAPYESLAVSMYMSTYPAGTSPYDPRAASADATYVLLRPTDSAASATALACGVKTYNGWLGMDSLGMEVLNMAELAQKKGKAAGVAGAWEGPGGLWTWSSTASSLDSLAKGLGNLPERLVGVYKNPRLSQLAPAALNVLDAHGQGFFLLLEGGKVDWAGHANSGEFLLESMQDFNEAASVVIGWIGEHGGWEHNLLG